MWAGWRERPGKRRERERQIWGLKWLMDEPRETKQRRISGGRYRLFSSLRLSICQDKWHHERFGLGRRRSVGGFSSELWECGRNVRRRPQLWQSLLSGPLGRSNQATSEPSAGLAPIILITDVASCRWATWQVNHAPGTTSRPAGATFQITQQSPSNSLVPKIANTFCSTSKCWLESS